jgi:hypothetical protein
VVHLGEPVLDTVLAAAHVEHVRDVAGSGTVSVARRQPELDAIVREHRVDFVRHSRDQGDQEGRGGDPAGFFHQLGKGELAGAVDSYKQIKLSLGCLHFSNVDVEEADGVALELLLSRLVTLDIREPSYGMPLQTTMKRGARQVRDRWLQGIEAVIQRQERVPAEGNNDRLLIG